MSDTNKERLKAIREAWRSERRQVCTGMGTRDWSQSEQRQIVAKGRADGYEGHHMKSVKDYPQHAGNPQNIQFLNRSEHINGAHRGNSQNATNGYYNPQTGTMHSFGKNDPAMPQSQALSAPLTPKQQDLAIKREQIRKQAAQQAKADFKQSAPQAQSSQVNKQTAANKGIAGMQSKTAGNQPAAQPSQNKGIESFRQKTASSQSAQTGKSSNQGIQSFKSKSSGQTSTASKGVSSGQSSGSSKGQGR